jgi:putative hydrolase of the HAD superfamily
MYETLLEKHSINASGFLMVGNSLKSDIVPVIEIGGHAVYIPYPLTWAHENLIDEQIDTNAYHEIENLGQLPSLVEMLSVT